MKIPKNVDVVAVIVCLFDEVSIELIKESLDALTTQILKDAFSAYLYDHLGRNIGTKFVSKSSWSLYGKNSTFKYRTSNSFVVEFSISDNFGNTLIEWNLHG